MRLLSARHRPAGRRARATAAALATGMVAAVAAVATPAAPAVAADLPDCFTSVTGNVTATPAVIDQGQSSTLRWTVTGATGCPGVRIRLAGTLVSSSGTRVVQPVNTSSFPLVASVTYFDPELHRVVTATRTLRSVTVTVRGALPVSMKLSTFRVDNADEDSFFSNGDEPWLMVFPILVDGTTVNLADPANSAVRVLSAPRAHDNLNRNGVDAGDSFAVPADTGTFSASIRPVRGLPTNLGESLATVAFAVIAIEEDLTPDSAANAGRAAAQAELRKQLETLVRNLQVPDASSIETIKAAVKAKVKSAMRRETLASFGLFGFIDPDDYIKAEVVQASYASIRDAGNAGIPVNITLAKSGVQYRVFGSIKAQPVATQLSRG